jgi:aspartate racemase
MKKLGLIGGTSWYTTEAYYRLINEGFAKVKGNWESPEILIFCINIAVMRSQDELKIKATYLETAQKLQSAGAEALMICANTPHLVIDEVQPKIGIPFLHIAEATGKEARRLGMKTLGLLGNKPTMTGDFISGYLKRNFNMDVLIPQGGAIDRSHYFVSKELSQGVFSETAKTFYLEEIAKLEKRGVDGVILGCTEIPLLLKEVESKLPLLSTTHLHTAMAVDFLLQN